MDIIRNKPNIIKNTNEHKNLSNQDINQRQRPNQFPNNSSRFEYCPGTLIENSHNQQKYGVFIKKIGNKLYFFRLEDDRFPVFSQIDKIQGLNKCGTINDNDLKTQTLKNELLKYYRTRKLDENEQILLHSVMKYAFPYGIPQHSSEKEIDHQKLRKLELNQSLDNGSQLYLNTIPNSTIDSLNNKKVFVIERTPKGIWVMIPQNNIRDSHFQHLFYKNKSIPSFSGISNIIPEDNQLDNQRYQDYYSVFKNHPKTCNINVKGQKVKIDPENNKVLLPENMNTMTYCPKTDTLLGHPKQIEYNNNNINDNDNNFNDDDNDNNNNNDNDFNDDDNDNDNDNDNDFNNNNNNDNDFNNNNQVMTGGAKKSKEEDFEFVLEDDYDLQKNQQKDDLIDQNDEIFFDDSELEFMKSLQKSKKTKKTKKSKKEIQLDNNNNNNDENDDDDEFEEFDDDFEILEVIEKDVIQEKEEKDKVYNESLQISELNKIFTYQYPFILRNNEMIKTKVIKKVNQYINLKNNIIINDKNQKIYNNINPLLLDYINGNLNNPFLVPLVINTKKIYLDTDANVDAEDFDKSQIQIKDFYSEILSLNYLMEFKKYNKNKDVNQVYNFDKFMKEIKDILKPTHSNNNYSNEKNNNFDQFNIKLGQDNLELNQIKMKKIFDISNANTTFIKKTQLQNQINNKNVLTVKYCKSPFICQNILSNRISNDSQVNIGSVFKFYEYQTNQEGSSDEQDTKNYSFNKPPTDENIINDKKFINNYNVYQYIKNDDADNINIIGFFRLPLNLIYSIDNSGVFKEANKSYTNDILLKYMETNSIVVVEVNDKINDIEKENLFFKNPENLVIFLFVKNKNNNQPRNDEELPMFYNLVNKILPTFNNIIDFHKGDFKKYNSQSLINNVLEFYKYQKSYLNIEQKKEILKLETESFKKESTKIKSFVKDIEGVLKSVKKRRSLSTQNKSIDGLISMNLIEELEKITNTKYAYKNSLLNDDRMKLNYIISEIPYGVSFLSLSQSLENYDKLDIDKLMQENTILIDKLHKEIEILKLKTNDKSNKKDTDKSCNKKSFGKTKIVKYKSIKDLEKDNGVDITDTDNNPIVEGDFAILEIKVKDQDELKKKIYKRVKIAGLDQWIIDSKKSIQEILELEKKQFYNQDNFTQTEDEFDEETQKCNSIYSNYFNFDLKAPNCTFDLDTMECLKYDQTINQKEIQIKDDKIKILKDDIFFYKNINKEKKELENRLKNVRKMILNDIKKKSNIKKDEIEKSKEVAFEVQKFLEEKVKCVHTDMLKFIGKIKNTTEVEKYQYYQLVLNNYHNTNFILDLDTVYENDENDFGFNQSGQSEQNLDELNHTTCNICNQKLVCKHWLAGIKMLETEGTIDFGKLTDIYGYQSNGKYICRICGEVITSTDTLDIIEGGRGDLGKAVAFREVMKDDTKNEKKIQLLDQYLKELELDENYDTDTHFKLDFYYHLKQLLNLKLTNEDEKEMIIFLNTYNFVKKEVFYQKIRVAQPNIPLKIVHTLVQTNFNKRLCCDIAARFLITLQTSDKEYVIKNNYCSPNFIGFPLINDINQRDGINLLNCIFNQMATRKKYRFLDKNCEKMIIDKLYYFIENDEFIQNKILKTIDDKTKHIFKYLDFNSYKNKLWTQFLPFLELRNFNYKMEKKLSESDLKLINGKNYSKMLLSSYENLFYYSNQSMYLINKVVEDEAIRNKFYKSASITNSCCLELLRPPNFHNYFFEKDPSIEQNINLANKTYQQYYDINRYRVHNIKKINTQLYDNTSLKIIPLHFKVDLDEIKELFIKYIDEGIHKGKEHDYNEYNICTLTNKTKASIIKEVYTIHDYNRLLKTIYKRNIRDTQEKNKEELDKQNQKYDVKALNNFKNKNTTIKYLDYIINITKNEEKLDLLTDLLNKLKDNYSVKKESKIKFDFYLKLVGETNINIKKLTKLLKSKEKSKQIFKKNLENLGNYTQLYNERLERFQSSSKAENFKNKFKEKRIKKDFRYLLESISIIKNKKYKYYRNVQDIRSEYQYLYVYKDETELFSSIYSKLKTFKKLFKVVEGQVNSYFSPEYSSIILHYLFVQVLFIILDLKIKKISGLKNNKQSKVLKKNQIQKNNKKTKKLKSQVLEVSSEQEDDAFVLEEEDFNIKKDKDSSDLKQNYYLVSEFLIICLKYIFKRQENIDILTEENIKQKIADTEQKQQRRNLKIHQILKTEEGMDEHRNMILSKLHYGILDYHSLEGEIKNLGLQEHIDNYDSNIQDKDDITDKEFYNQETPDDNDYNSNFNDGNIVYDADEDDVEDGDFIF